MNATATRELRLNGDVEVGGIAKSATDLELVGNATSETETQRGSVASSEDDTGQALHGHIKGRIDINWQGFYHGVTELQIGLQQHGTGKEHSVLVRNNDGIWESWEGQLLGGTWTLNWVEFNTNKHGWYWFVSEAKALSAKNGALTLEINSRGVWGLDVVDANTGEPILDYDVLKGRMFKGERKGDAWEDYKRSLVRVGESGSEKSREPSYTAERDAYWVHAENHFYNCVLPRKENLDLGKSVLVRLAPFGSVQLSLKVSGWDVLRGDDSGLRAYLDVVGEGDVPTYINSIEVAGDTELSLNAVPCGAVTVGLSIREKERNGLNPILGPRGIVVAKVDGEVAEGETTLLELVADLAAGRALAGNMNVEMVGPPRNGRRFLPFSDLSIFYRAERSDQWNIYASGIMPTVHWKKVKDDPALYQMEYIGLKPGFYDFRPSAISMQSLAATYVGAGETASVLIEGSDIVLFEVSLGGKFSVEVEQKEWHLYWEYNDGTGDQVKRILGGKAQNRSMVRGVKSNLACQQKPMWVFARSGELFSDVRLVDPGKTPRVELSLSSVGIRARVALKGEFQQQLGGGLLEHRVTVQPVGHDGVFMGWDTSVHDEELGTQSMGDLIVEKSGEYEICVWDKAMNRVDINAAVGRNLILKKKVDLFDGAVVVLSLID